MLRRSLMGFIGADGGVFMSRVKDKQYLEHRLATLGRLEAAGDFKPSLLTQEEVQRFTTSSQSKENLINKEQGAEPVMTVDDDGRVRGSAHADPTRYGDWEVNGRCYDF